MALREHQAGGLEYLELVTVLLQRARRANPTGGVWEAADLQWWWRRDQHPDPAGQTFWLLDDAPVAAVVMTNWGDKWGCDLLSADHDLTNVMEVMWPRALGQTDALRDRSVEMIVRDDNLPLIDAVTRAGFEATDEADVTTWMSAAERPKVNALVGGFELAARSDNPARPHHMIRRSGEHVAERLGECSLYRPELDLAVYAPNGEVAAYGLFWADLTTKVGLVEPMRTEARYQRMGLGRHVLTEGLKRLATFGCSRLKVSYIVGNEASQRLYLGAGFRPDSAARTYRR
jgi:RimJ/RimL family protein N-acetyltransferase